MIILDTNVVSEPTKPKPDPVVRAWLDRQVPETLYLTAISLAELLAGVAKLPSGRRKRDFGSSLLQLLERFFGPRILPFDRAAAEAFASLTEVTLATGRKLALADGQIAAIAMTHGFSIATRDTAPFKAARLIVLNPWEHKAI